MPAKASEAAHLKPKRGNEQRIYELVSEIKRKGISLEGIEFITDPDHLELYGAADNIYRSMKVVETVVDFGKALSKVLYDQSNQKS